MARRSVTASERLQSIQTVGSGLALLMGLLALLCAARGVLVTPVTAAVWQSFVIAAAGGLLLAGTVYLARWGYEQIASWLLVMVVAGTVVVEATVALPESYHLLWPLYVVPIMVAQVILGSRTGLLAGLGAIPMFVFGYFQLAERPDLLGGMDQAIVTNLWLYLLVAALMHVALVRVVSAQRRMGDLSSSHERARMELRERDEQFRALADSSATGILIHQDGRLVYGNRRFFEMAQTPSSDGFGLSLWDFFDEAGVQELQAQLRRRRSLKGRVPPSLLSFRPLKGPPRWCEVAVDEAMFWQKPAIVANVLDVTERVEAQLEVQRQRDFSNNIINTAEAIILATDAEGRLTLLNPAGEHITGYSFEQLRDRPYWEILAPPERREQAEAAFEATRQQSRGSAELMWLSRDGEEITISWHYVSQHDAAGNFTGIVAVGIDVTQQRILERQAMVTERLRSLGQIAGGVAHDLNNMLTGIIGPTDLLLMEETDAEKQRILNGILAAATRGAETVRRIQSFSKARTDLDRKVFDLRELTEEVIFSLRPRWRDAAQRQGIRIQIHDEVPPGLKVLASSGEIGNVLMNLIVNACEAMTQDGEITIRGAQRGDQIEFEVRDTGSGMSPETMENIFKPFFSTKGADNSGLGLAVIHGIILRHGGTITVDSELGKGTTFRVALPASVAEQETVGRRVGEEGTGHLRILVVDDMPEIADYIAAVANRNGHQARAVHGGEEGLAALQVEPYDALITDYGMEGVSGVKLADKARRLYPGIKTVLVTGWDVSLEEFEGFTELLRKPCTREQIEDMLRGLVK